MHLISRAKGSSSRAACLSHSFVLSCFSSSQIAWPRYVFCGVARRWLVFGRPQALGADMTITLGMLSFRIKARNFGKLSSCKFSAITRMTVTMMGTTTTTTITPLAVPDYTEPQLQRPLMFVQHSAVPLHRLVQAAHN